jgi:hypothetical protein
VRPQEVHVGAVTIEPAEIPPLESAARYFHELEPDKAFRLTGWVTELHRGKAEEAGDITIQGMTDSGVRLVRVTLEASEYDTAITAHRERSVISCIGTLTHARNRYRLANPESFRIIGSES